MKYAHVVAIEHLKMKAVSKAAAWQRTGRAGREVSRCVVAGETVGLKMRSDLDNASDSFRKSNSTNLPISMRQRFNDVILQRRFYSLLRWVRIRWISSISIIQGENQASRFVQPLHRMIQTNILFSRRSVPNPRWTRSH